MSFYTIYCIETWFPIIFSLIMSTQQDYVGWILLPRQHGGIHWNRSNSLDIIIPICDLFSLNIWIVTKLWIIIIQINLLYYMTCQLAISLHSKRSEQPYGQFRKLCGRHNESRGFSFLKERDCRYKRVVMLSGNLSHKLAENPPPPPGFNKCRIP